MKVLIADDDKISRLLMKNLIASMGFEALEAEDGEQAWEILQAHSPRLIVIDWMMSKLEGTELCRRLRSTGGEKRHYIILLTGKNSKEDIAAGLRAGVDDYITKPFIAQEFELRLRIGARMLEMQQSLQEALGDQHYMAQHDVLTGILNRVEIIKTLEKEHNRAGRNNGKLSIILGNLDHFRQVNESYGQGAGDAVLAEIARRMKGALRIYDTVGRYGGEEFLLVLPGCSLDEGRLIARRILHIVKDQPVMFYNNDIKVTISLGLSCNDHMDPDGMVQAADNAVRLAKRNGRDRYEAAE